jgi:N-acetylmuramoyl-L-alanine amidase
MLTLTDGKIIDGSIVVSLSPKIEHGPLKNIHALVMHQTGGEDAQGALASYKTSPYGAHFLIDKDGTIYQTARVTQKVFHIGKIRSRCASLCSCSPKEDIAIKTILASKVGYSQKITEISAFESKKAYPCAIQPTKTHLALKSPGN